MSHSRKMFRKSNWTNGFIPFLLIIFIVVVSLSVHGVAAANKRHQAAVQLAAQKSACTLTPQTFLNSVNQIRVAKGESPLTYSDELESVAQARLADMTAGAYYSHVNPTTKQGYLQVISKYDTSSTRGAEVLDAPNNATQSLTNFQTSPDHLQILTDSSLLYVGMKSVYEPENWPIYSADGVLQNASPGVTNCIVIADFADKVDPPTKTTNVDPEAAYKQAQQGLEDQNNNDPRQQDEQSSPTALCNDGSVSYSQHRSGTCSYHNGVSTWYQ